MPESTPSNSSSLAGLYEQHADGLLAFLCGRLKDAALAEDVLHDVFIAYHRQSIQTQIDTPKAYLYMAAQRQSLNLLRQQAQDTRLQARLAHEHSFQSASGADPFEVDAARRALDELSAEDRDVITLRVYASMSYPEIAAVLQMSLTTVHRRYGNSIGALRRALEGRSTN